MLGLQKQLLLQSNLSLDLLGSSGNIPGFINFTGTNLTKWAAAKAARAAGTRNATVLCVGDSTTAGLGGGATGGGDANAVAFAWPAQLAALMSNASASSMFCSHNQNINFDSRIALTGGWTRVGADTSVGGPMWDTASAGRFSFTPTNQVDTFVVKFPTIAAGGLGTMNASIDAGGTTLINEGLANGFSSQTFTTTLGNHTFNLDWVSGTIYAADIIAYNSAAKEISIYNAGWSTSATSNWLNAASLWNPYPVLGTLAADLVPIGLMINDAAQAVSLSTYNTNLSGLVTQSQVAGSVILLSGNPIDPVGNSLPTATQATYVAQMRTAALANNVPMIDVFNLFGGSYAAAVAKGWMFTDGVHPNATGYAQIASYVNRALATGFVSR
jgi:lysophospholipase L1-like esterase